jgi:hypothetical protein
MHRKLVAAVAVAVLGAVAAVSAAGGTDNPYQGASWYSKYLAVTAPATPLCTSNVGDVGQISFPGTPVNVDASHECGSQSETSIAINPADTTNVIAGSNEIQRNPMRAMASFDGGATFTGVDLPLPTPRTQQGFNFGSDPGVAFDADGNAYYSYIVVELGKGGLKNGTPFNGSEMAVAHSGDGGKTWTATYFAPSNGNAHFNDKPMIAVDTGAGPGHHHNRVYVSWDNVVGNSSSEKNGNNIVLSYSDDGGATFTDPVSVSGNFIGKTAAIGADPYVAANGTLHVAWHDPEHGQIFDASSPDGGVTFSAPHTIATVPGFQFSPVAQAVRGALVYPACGAAGTSLYCSYTAETSDGVKVFVARSTDGGVTWPTVTQMPAGGDQFNQWLAVDPSDGSVNVAYYDTQVKDSPSTIYTLARSTNGGASYAPQPIATAPTDETGGAGVNLGNQYGDYEGIAALGGTVRPVWTDRRQDVIDLGLREEVFTASLSFP